METQNWWQRVTAFLAAVVFMSVTAAPAWANDYVVTFMKETYKAQPADQGGKIYHTWSVSSDFGNKLLVLTGEDSQRRQWLQEFSKNSPLFLLSIPEKSTGAFELNTVFEIDVTAIHPIDATFTAEPKKKKKRK
ncbi:MAG: hypothetical protein ABIL58_18445 [Pseudomonadota bacterium]